MLSFARFCPADGVGVEQARLIGTFLTWVEIESLVLTGPDGPQNPEARHLPRGEDVFLTEGSSAQPVRGPPPKGTSSRPLLPGPRAVHAQDPTAQSSGRISSFRGPCAPLATGPERGRACEGPSQSGSENISEKHGFLEVLLIKSILIQSSRRGSGK